jgi:peptide deformylase
VSEEVEGQVREEKPRDPEAEARRRIALAQIRQWGDGVLSLRAGEVEEFDDDLRRLVERMSHLMREAQGVGLAATQVGVLRRLFVFQPNGDEEVQAVVNPELEELSDERAIENEGCLSLQGVSVPVERHCRVTLVGRAPTGEEARWELSGLGARVVQHELDHLDGTLILDRTTPEARRAALATLRPRPVLGPIR